LGRKFVDLTNREFNRLTVIREVGRSNSGDVLWLCKCNCGNLEDIIVTSSNLQLYHTQSCGCYKKEKISEAKKINNIFNTSGEYGLGYTTKNEEFYFDLEDYKLLNSYSWHTTDNGYLTNNYEHTHLYLHRLIMKVNKKDEIVDHINGNKLDNRKCNLRVCTQSNNQMNCEKQKNNTSSVTGVSFHYAKCKWRAYITINKKQIQLGHYNDFNDAVSARKSAEKIYFGKYSYDESRCINV